eukprot:CAMPEP_0182605710 /NCGR_PEP_ID=MMETSP1330-20130603/658_1 /TAXON_ID=464278 /ORGANISM="Picochlorum sp., Strain RCC944" /LENGTH=49 /DNA_ID= /DNA_START= /DNA_END= /DNA_ORIENTATION=
MPGIRSMRPFSADSILPFMYPCTPTDVSRHLASKKSSSLKPHILWKYTS